MTSATERQKCRATERQKCRRMTAAGFAPLPRGWVPAAYARRVQQILDKHAADAKRAAETKGKVGRPAKNNKA